MQLTNHDNYCQSGGADVYPFRKCSFFQVVPELTN